jgi:hypothetical protein
MEGEAVEAVSVLGVGVERGWRLRVLVLMVGAAL